MAISPTLTFNCPSSSLNFRFVRLHLICRGSSMYNLYSTYIRIFFFSLLFISFIVWFPSHSVSPSLTCSISIQCISIYAIANTYSRAQISNKIHKNYHLQPAYPFQTKHGRQIPIVQYHIFFITHLPPPGHPHDPTPGNRKQEKQKLTGKESKKKKKQQQASKIRRPNANPNTQKWVKSHHAICYFVHTHRSPAVISIAPLKLPIFQHVNAARNKQENAALRSSYVG